LLHIAEQTDLSDDQKGARLVSTRELFSKRVIDELIRFPNRREQLMNKNKISKLSTVIDPIHDGDQYIIPESSTEWTNLLRFDWLRMIPETPQYYEEMTGVDDGKGNNSKHNDDSKHNNDSKHNDDSKGNDSKGNDSKGNDSKHNDNKGPKKTLNYRDNPALVDIFGEASPYDFTFIDIDPASKNPLEPLAGILGIALDRIGIREKDTILTSDHMVQYTIITDQPIGLINLIDQQIECYKKYNKPYPFIIFIILLPNLIGIIREHDNITLRIPTLPEMLQEAWKDAQFVKHIASKDTVKDTIVIGQIPKKSKANTTPILIEKAPEVLVEKKEQPPDIRRLVNIP
jgi:hypothetical protein